jgi:hypothetical protein
MKNKKAFFRNKRKSTKFSTKCGVRCFYFKNKLGLLHRVGAPAYVYFEKSKHGYYKKIAELWYLNGKLHRIDGPAAKDCSGQEEWWYKGIKHRCDGPAIRWSNGVEEWFIMGEQYLSQDEWFNDLTREDQLAYLFKLNT